ncbi:hypothetical protein DR61_1310 [Burkholderia pseudomallei]|uniref:Uncharacterized protein n=1 Tax=Burkholderia pseudomallei 1710a TaxID=320371 RepID=A0A0E1WAK0_BURPE|nr:hypothetical protein [Burkholderia pseudomallei]AIS46400.1 hypothetical protein DR61_1310 [Burkholderia pseudomallei]EET09331.1 hypothetical protein BURPS1710A_1855 [Burkholderia pseudomallei 1710a]KGD19864.1 hypothetical protein DR60_4375 [Burkholderia pseudomallei]
MHKYTAALLAAFAATKDFAARIAERIRKFLVALHVASLKRLVFRTVERARRVDDDVRYHEAGAAEARIKSDEAWRHADGQLSAAKRDAAKHGTTL